MPSRRLRVLFVGGILLIGLILLTIQVIHNTYYKFTARLPEAAIMQSAQGQPFGEMSEISSNTVAACIASGLAPQRGANPPYVDGNLIAIHITNTTQIIDARKASAPVAADASRLQPGQVISVETDGRVELAWSGNAVATRITIAADGTPQPCESYVLRQLEHRP